MAGSCPLGPKACPSCRLRPRVGCPACADHVGVIDWARMGDPELGDWGPPVLLVRTGVIPDEYETAEGQEQEPTMPVWRWLWVRSGKPCTL